MLRRSISMRLCHGSLELWNALRTACAALAATGFSSNRRLYLGKTLGKPWENDERNIVFAAVHEEKVEFG